MTERLGLFWANRNAKVDRLLKGRPTLVVSNGVFNLDGLEHLGISKREIFQMARQNGHNNLGGIRRMYIETDDKPNPLSSVTNWTRFAQGYSLNPPGKWISMPRSRREASSSRQLLQPALIAGKQPSLMRAEKFLPALAASTQYGVPWNECYKRNYIFCAPVGPACHGTGSPDSGQRPAWSEK